MNFLLVHHCGLLGGGTLSCFDVVKMLKNKGHSVKLALINPSKNILEICRANEFDVVLDTPEIVNFTYHNASSSAIHCYIKYLLSVKNKTLWKDFLNKNNPDYLLLNSSAMAPILGIAKEMKIKCGCFIRETKRGHAYAPAIRFQRKMLANADKLFFLTEYDKTDWACSSDCEQYVIPDVVDTDQFKIPDKAAEALKKQNNVNEGTFCILYMGGISSVKGALDIISASQKLVDCKRDVCLLLLGGDGKNLLNAGIKTRLLHFSEYKYVKKCYKSIEALGDCVKVVGLVSDTSEWYCMSDVVVFPVKKVHQARPAYEAGFYYKPIIVPNYKNFKDIVADGVNGMVYPVDDIDGLASCLARLNDDVDLRKNMGINNYRFYDENHNFSKTEELLDKAFG